jgi:hypothetical protein
MATTPFYDFTSSVDAPNVLNMSRNIISILDIDASGSQINNAQNVAYTTSFPGYTRDDLASIEEVFETMDIKYQTMLQNIQSANDMTNINSYMGNMYDAESKRITSLKNTSVNNVFKMRQTYMTTKYAVAYNQFISKVLMFTLTILVMCAILGCLAVWPATKPTIAITIAICGAITIVVIYLIILALFYHRMLERRKDDWNKFYFNNPGDKGNNGSCAQ